MAIPRQTLLIVGGGLSGALVAIHLMRRAPAGTRVLIVERRPPLGRGVAYGTDCPDHLLNVPAGRMSLFPEDPGHFLRWAQARLSGVAAGNFLPRELFGRYVGESLAAAASAPGVVLESIAGEAVDLEEIPGGARVVLADDRAFEAAAVLLALGHLPGEYPIQRSLAFYRGPRYHHVPWVPGLMANIGLRDDVLVVGAGLTAIDIIVQLDRLGHRGTVYAFSRRGLRPLAHQPGVPEWPSPFADAVPPANVLGVLRRLRAEIRRAAAEGVDWRAVLDSIRPQSQDIWCRWSWKERARFLRHVRPFWEVHRHRLPPATAAIVDRLAAEGRVRFVAARLEALHDAPTGAEVAYRLRASGKLGTLRVAKVINCTGPRTDYSKYQHPLLINLLARGLIGHDPLALGLDALPTGEVLRYHAGPAGWLFTLGAPLKGMLWEATAVPEIRVQAPAMAARMLAAAGAGRPPGTPDPAA